MGLLSSLFKRNKSEKIEELQPKQYLLGWEVSLDGKEHCSSFIETQNTTKKIAESQYCHIELTFDNDGELIEAIKKDEDGNNEELIIGGNIEYSNLRINRFINFYKNDSGLNTIGGKIPENFIIPENKCPGSFQYLGKLSHESIGFNWLPFDLNLICPIYLDIDKVWLNYSNPNSPTIINLEEINNLSTAYDDLKTDSFIEFEEIQFSAQEENQNAHQLGHSGLPNWVQYSDIPRCPQTNKTMRFVCQLLSNNSVKTTKTNIQPKDDWYKQYFKKLNFWGDGDLFVFFEPESKIACYMIQNT